MTDTRLFLRAMAWERAKGELMSILQAYYREMDKYENMEKLINKFVKEVEENEYHV